MSRLRTFPWARLRGANNEGALVVLILMLAIAVGISTPAFWSASTLLNVLTNSMINVVFAMGVLIVIISAGIDVSFMAIGIFSGYSVIVFTNATGFGAGHAVVGFAIAALIGLALGVLNAIAIPGLRIPTLIATLGTRGVITGAMLLWVGSKVVPDYPSGLNGLSTNYLVTAHGAAGATRLSVLIVPAVVICVLVGLLLRYTMIGRSIYAIGGDEESARRAGIPVAATKVFIYLLVGLLAGFAGMMHVTQVRLANPYELVGGELDVIAAVVLGGASIFGGSGSVTGTALGVVLISLVNNSLILLGVPSSWQRLAVGLLLLVGISAQALSARAGARRRYAVANEASA
ncbi:MAG TPA: ABC transporter permease [Gaiellaceae bacterium]